jgi:hypothetical protein
LLELLGVPSSSYLGRIVRIALHTAMTLPRSLKWIARVFSYLRPMPMPIAA